MDNGLSYFECREGCGTELVIVTLCGCCLHFFWAAAPALGQLMEMQMPSSDIDSRRRFPVECFVGRDSL